MMIHSLRVILALTFFIKYAIVCCLPDDVCPLLPNPIHATVDVQCPLVAVPGTSCVHQCDSGYIQVGGDMRRYCTEEKKWTGRDIICLRKLAVMFVERYYAWRL